MIKIIISLFFILFLSNIEAFHENYSHIGITPINNCITFSVSQGTGCQWMCNYCSNMLGTFNYYFTDNICVYQTGGCVGYPIVGKPYTCCSV